MVTGSLFGLVPLDVPIGIDRDEAQRRAAEELAKAKYGGTPQWVSDAADRADRFVQWMVELFLRLLANRDPAGNIGVNWGFVIAIAAVDHGRRGGRLAGRPAALAAQPTRCDG